MKRKIMNSRAQFTQESQPDPFSVRLLYMVAVMNVCLSVCEGFAPSRR